MVNHFHAVTVNASELDPVPRGMAACKNADCMNRSCCRGLKLLPEKCLRRISWERLHCLYVVEIKVWVQNMAQGRLDSVVEVVSNAKREVGAVAYYNIDQRYCERLVQVPMPTSIQHKRQICHHMNDFRIESR